MAEINYLVGGEAGQGVQTIGLVLGKTMARHGLHVFLDQDYESRVRGGHSFVRVRVSDVPVAALSEELDVLIALDKKTIETHLSEVKRDGAVIFDPDAASDPLKNVQSIAIPFEKTAVDTSGNKIMSNSVAIGACIAVGGYDFEEVLSPILKEQFQHLGDAIVEGNLKAARAGFDFVRSQQGSIVREAHRH